MKINSLSFVNRNSFGSSFVYKDRYIPDKHDQTHDILRAHFEEKLGPQIFYYDQLIKEDLSRIPSDYNFKLKNGENKPANKNFQVDTNALRGLHIYSFKERRPNEIYSGAQLAYQPEVLNTLKKSGINTVLCLVKYLDYEENAKSAGLNFVELPQLKDSGLCVFDINGDLIKNLIKNPDLYASNNDEDGKLAGLKEFIKILNGESDEYPLPIYFGCQNGTDRTYMWFELYKILKDEPMDKPLSEEVIEKLAEFANEADDYFRW